jgi:hypothetical protein
MPIEAQVSLFTPDDLEEVLLGLRHPSAQVAGPMSYATASLASAIFR